MFPVLCQFKGAHEIVIKIWTTESLQLSHEPISAVEITNTVRYDPMVNC